MPYLISVLVWSLVLSLIGWAWGWLWYSKLFAAPKEQMPQSRPGAMGWTWFVVFLSVIGFWYIWSHNPLPFTISQELLAGAVLGVIIWFLLIFPVYKMGFVWDARKTKRQFWVDNTYWLTMFIIWGILLPLIF